MGWYSDHVLPKLLDLAMDTQHIRRIRARVTAGLAGEVVEVGFGTGHNLAYLPASVTRLLAVEPSRSSVRLAAARIAASAITRFSEPYASIALDAETAEATMSASQSSTWLTRIRRTGVEPNVVRSVAATRDQLSRACGARRVVDHGVTDRPHVDERRR